MALFDIDVRARHTGANTAHVSVSAMASTPGYRLEFHKDPHFIYPPQWDLIAIPPAGIQRQVISPVGGEFDIAVSENQKSITVHYLSKSFAVSITD